VVLKQIQKDGVDAVVQKVLLVSVLENSQDVIRKVNTASEYGQAAQSAEAMNILGSLQKMNKIAIQDLGVNSDDLQPQEQENDEESSAKQSTPE
jgi:hypothetical protein